MKPVIIIAIAFVLLIFVPTLANGDEYAEKWKQYVESYKEYMEIYRVWAHDTINFYKSQLIESNKSLEILKDENDQLKSTNSLLSAQLELSEKAYYLMVDSNDEYRKYADKIDSYFDEEDLKPQTMIYDQIVHWRVSDSKGNTYTWQLPVEDYEEFVIADRYPDKLSFKSTTSGDTFSVIDHTKYVLTSFSKTIDQVYDNAEDDEDFMYEVWFITSQLTTYSFDIGDYPRYALETLSRGGGDCEDTTILILDMLKSSSHTKNWKFQMLYFDSEELEKPQGIDHVVPVITIGDNQWIIESTAKSDEGMNRWNDEYISGWWIDV